MPTNRFFKTAGKKLTDCITTPLLFILALFSFRSVFPFGGPRDDPRSALSIVRALHRMIFQNDFPTEHISEHICHRPSKETLPFK